MNKYERKMFELLKDLKENHHVIGIKISFEDEGLTGELAQIIASIAFKAGVSVTMKIGGCEAKRDMLDAKILGVNKIVAPMVETPYALKKFVEATQNIFKSADEDDCKFAVNIETITGFDNLEKMLKLENIDIIDSIVLGRSDFVGSLGLSKEQVNSDEVYGYAAKIAQMCKSANKHLFVGGNLTDKSVEFFKKLSSIYLSGVETRNIIFDRAVVEDENISQAIEKALEFELLWLKDKKTVLQNLANDDILRIEKIQQRLVRNN